MSCWDSSALSHFLPCKKKKWRQNWCFFLTHFPTRFFFLFVCLIALWRLKREGSQWAHLHVWTVHPVLSQVLHVKAYRGRSLEASRRSQHNTHTHKHALAVPCKTTNGFLKLALSAQLPMLHQTFQAGYQGMSEHTVSQRQSPSGLFKASIIHFPAVTMREQCCVTGL